MTPTLGSLFAGIGGFDLAFTRAGFRVAWQVEIEPYCQKVLAKHFPEAERYGDIRECGRHNLKPVDVISAGFPCQDISFAGRGAGIEEGTRSGLWSEASRIIGELRPRYVLLENVAALLVRGMGRVLADLSKIGYDAEWEVISAADVGAPHLRERVWIMAYPNGARCGDSFSEATSLAYSDQSQNGLSGAYGAVADSIGARLEGHARHGDDCGGRKKPNGSTGARSLLCHPANWTTEPNVGRVAYGVPARVDRLRALGNALVPQIPEGMAHRIREALQG